MRDDSAEIFFQSFLQEATVISSGTGGDVHSDVVHPAFPRLTTASPIIQGALKDGFGEAVVACDIPEPCQFPSLDSCQKRLQWTHEEADLPSHPVVGLVFQVGDAEKFPSALGFESMDPFFLQSQQARSIFYSRRTRCSDKRLANLQRACKADAVAPPDPV